MVAGEKRGNPMMAVAEFDYFGDVVPLGESNLSCFAHPGRGESQVTSPRLNSCMMLTLLYSDLAFNSISCRPDD